MKASKGDVLLMNNIKESKNLKCILFISLSCGRLQEFGPRKRQKWHWNEGESHITIFSFSSF